MSESEKITCPWCGTERDYGAKLGDAALSMQIPCSGCERYFDRDHARLAVQHARLVEAVRTVRDIATRRCMGGTPQDRLVAVTLELNNALEDK